MLPAMVPRAVLGKAGSAVGGAQRMYVRSLAGMGVVLQDDPANRQIFDEQPAACGMDVPTWD